MIEFGTIYNTNFTIIKPEARSKVGTLKTYESHIHADRRFKSFVSKKILIS